MNRKEFSQFAAALRTFFPREKLLPNKEAMELWFAALKDIPYEDASRALNRWVMTEKWSPSVADIRAGVVQVHQKDEALDWAGGWEEVTRAISKFGSWNKTDALESMSPVTRQCVQSIGWDNICLSENIAVERGHFRTMFESRMSKVEKAQQTPPELRSPVENRLLDFGNMLRLDERTKE